MSGLERELALLERRLRAELRADLDQRLLELTRYVDDQLEDLQQRVDRVHSAALRQLIRSIAGGTQ